MPSAAVHGAGMAGLWSEGAPSRNHSHLAPASVSRPPTTLKLGRSPRRARLIDSARQLLDVVFDAVIHDPENLSH